MHYCALLLRRYSYCECSILYESVLECLDLKQNDTSMSTRVANDVSKWWFENKPMALRKIHSSSAWLGGRNFYHIYPPVCFFQCYFPKDNPLPKSANSQAITPSKMQYLLSLTSCITWTIAAAATSPRPAVATDESLTWQGCKSPDGYNSD